MVLVDFSEQIHCFKCFIIIGVIRALFLAMLSIKFYYYYYLDKVCIMLIRLLRNFYLDFNDFKKEMVEYVFEAKTSLDELSTLNVNKNQYFGRGKPYEFASPRHRHQHADVTKLSTF